MNTLSAFTFKNSTKEILDKSSFMMHTSISNTAKILNFCSNLKKLNLSQQQIFFVKYLKWSVFLNIAF